MAEIMIDATYRHPLRIVISTERITHGLTQAQLAQKSGYSQATIYRLEHGQMDPTLECLRDVLRALGMELVLGVKEALEAQPALL